MHIETNTKRTKNLVLLTTLDFMKSFWNHNNPTLDFIYPFKEALGAMFVIVKYINTYILILLQKGYFTYKITINFLINHKKIVRFHDEYAFFFLHTL